MASTVRSGPFLLQYSGPPSWAQLGTAVRDKEEMLTCSRCVPQLLLWGWMLSLLLNHFFKKFMAGQLVSNLVSLDKRVEFVDRLIQL